MLLADYSGMRMRGTTIGGKAEAGAFAILGVSASGVKHFLYSIEQIGKIGNLISSFLWKNRSSWNGCGLDLEPAIE